MRLAREWQAAHGSDLRGFVDLLVSRADGGDGARESEAPVESEALDAVRLMTIHRSKGLEFPVVCVADLGRQVLPRAGSLIRVGRDGGRLGLRLKQPGLRRARQRARLRRAQARGAGTRGGGGAAAVLRGDDPRQGAPDRLRRGAARALGGDQPLAPVGWIGAALVPEIAARAAAAAELTGAGPGAVDPEPFVTDDGVLVRFIGVSGAAPQAPVAPIDAGARGRGKRFQPPRTANRLPRPCSRAAAASPPVPASLSYTALATYEQCGYRFYAQRVLGLPDLPSPVFVPRVRTPTTRGRRPRLPPRSQQRARWRGVPSGAP